MSLTRLEISKLRNIDELALELNPRFNLFYGANGSGKTSILEAVYLLGLGRSFRHRSAQSVIQYGAEQLTVFGLLIKSRQPIPIGVQRTCTGKLLGRIHGETISQVAQLAQLLPLQLIEPNSYQLLTDGPKQRRQFIDWGLFHVEPRFLTLWKRWQRLLDQRNAALRQRLSVKEVISWDEEWVALSEELTQLRLNYLTQFIPTFSALVHQFSSGLPIEIKYRSGWQQELDLALALAKHLPHDRQAGYTQVGPQRADLVLSCNGHPVQDVLSRGQQKIVVYALRLAQGMLLEKTLGTQCIYLLDDLTAELDEEYCHRVIQSLLEFTSQALITGVDCQKLSYWLPQGETFTFHVKQGKVLQEN